VIAQTGEDIHETPALGLRVENPVGGDGEETPRLGQIEKAQGMARNGVFCARAVNSRLRLR
jgi:hypothetical protein